MASVRTISPMTSPAELPTDLETCHQLIRELLETLTRQTCLNEKLQHQLEQLLRRIYGRRSEKLDPNQLLLFAREILEATGVDPTATPSPSADASRPNRSIPQRRTVMAASLCPRAWSAGVRFTTSRPKSYRVPTAVSSAPRSARRSASSSITFRPAWS